MRTLRKVIDTALAIIGGLVIIGAVLLDMEQTWQIVVVIFGILLIEAGNRKVGHRYVPSQRRYLALRAETDQFLTLVRQLNTAALAVKQNDSPENHQAFEQVQSAMQQSVEHMADVAGKTDAELTTAEAEVSWKADFFGPAP